MQGTYRINIERDHRNPDKWHGWHLVVWLCSDLKAASLNYRTTLDLEPGGGGKPQVIVTAWGEPKPRKARKPKRCGYKPPAIPSLGTLTRRRAKAREALRIARARMLGRFRNYWAPLWRYEHAGRDVFDKLHVVRRPERLAGRWLAKRLASCPVSSVKPEDYTELEALLGCSLTRRSRLTTYHRERCATMGGGIKGYVLGYVLRVHTREWHPASMQPFPFEEFRKALDDFRFSDELLRLRAER